MDLAQQLFDEAFSVPRDPRSDAYKEGVLAVLRYYTDPRRRIRCTYPPASPEADAFYAGTNEGHSIWRRHREKE